MEYGRWLKYISGLALSVLLIMPMPLASALIVGLDRVVIGGLEPDYGYALDFDGLDDFVDISTYGSEMNLTSAWSIEAWINYEGEGIDQYITIFSKTEALVNDRRTNYELRIRASNNRFYTVYGNYTTAYYEEYISLLINQWVHVMGVWNGTDLYYVVDSVADLTPVVVSETPYTSFSQTVFIGESGRSNNYFFNGTIDELRVYDRALNQTEIDYSFNSGDGIHFPLDQSGLVAWYHFNEGEGVDIFDETENDNDGVLINGESDEWVEGFVFINNLYPININFSNLEPTYNVTLFDETTLLDSAIINANGNATLILSEAYRSSSFEGTIKIYDADNNHLDTFIYDDLRGGDVYQGVSEGLGLGFLGLIFGLVAFIIAITVVAKKKG